MSEACTSEATAVDSENSPTDSIAPVNRQPDNLPAIRLVIRAHIIPEEDPPIAAAQGSWNYRAIALAIGALAVLVLVVIGVFRAYSHSSRASESTQAAKSPLPTAFPKPDKATPVASVEPPSETRSAAASTAPNESAVLVPANKVIPNVSQSSLQTIHGTIKVPIRITVDPEGRVIAAAPHSRGPSRYFERIALDASKQWTFAPATADTKREALLQFNFSRNATSADVRPLR
jgi:TonB family protein